MDVLLNGDPHLIEPNCQVADLLATLELPTKFAVEINQQIIPRSVYCSTAIIAGDRIEIVQAIGGG